MFLAMKIRAVTDCGEYIPYFTLVTKNETNHNQSFR